MSHSYYTQDISATWSVLAEEHYDSYLAAADRALNSLKEQYQSADLALLGLPAKTSDLEAIEPIAARYCEEFDDVIILGTGGSSLGGQTICQLANTARPHLHFMANIDADSFDRLFQNITPDRTGFIVISKSGGTAETLSQFLYCLDVFRTHVAAAKIPDHFVVITQPGDQPLRRLANQWQLNIIDHAPDIGGRYAALSVVGLLPALIAGVDGYQIRDGAAAVLQGLQGATSAAENAPALGAMLNVALAKERNISVAVLMPYLDRLASFSSWWQQLWAESLGKDGQGTTPVRALGTVDQHSQLQLYLDGPKDKFFTLLMAEQANKGGLIQADLAADPELNFIAGKRLGDLMAAEQRATAETLIRNDCPTRIIKIKSLDEPTLGALLMHFMLETIIAAELWGVNAFDQPAVERSKILAKQYLQGEAD